MITSSQSHTINRASSSASLLNRNSNHSVSSIPTDFSHQHPPPHQRLKHQPSLIDLIDDTTLTSLPLPPPPKKYTSSRARNNSIETIPSLSSQQQQVNNNPNLQFPSDQESENNININFNEHDVNDDNDVDDEDDVTFEGDESQDPIVLIEDYMINDNEDEHENQSIDNDQPIVVTETFNRRSSAINKKKSLANFKQRMYSIPNFKIHNELIKSREPQQELEHSSEVATITSINTTPSLLRSNNKRAISAGGNSTTSSSSNGGNQTVRENLEEIFGGKIPGSDLLKYCDICERPLYEISSLLGNYHKKFKKSENNTLNTHTNNYDEFICWECIEIYEDFFNELELEKQHHNGNPSSNSNDKLLMIFKTIQLKYNQKENTPPPTSSTRKEFSNLLIFKLNTLKNTSSTSSTANHKFDLDWIKNLQVKMNWSTDNRK